MKWVGIFEERIFWVGDFPGRNLMGGNFLGGNSPEGMGIFLEPFLHIIYLFLFFKKIINKYNMTFNKKIDTLNS